jgi:nucleoside-diphosphate-sugar epimerase
MGRPGEAYLLAGKWHHLEQLTRILAKISGKKINAMTVPAFAANAGLPIVRLLAALQKKEPLYTEEALDALFNGNRFISSAKAMNELNYTIRPFEETLADTYHWFKNKSYL